MVWLLIHLACGHLNGCDLEAQTFQARAECEAAMSELHDSRRSICIPVVGEPVFRK